MWFLIIIICTKDHLFFCWMPQKLVNHFNQLLDKNFPIHLTRFIMSWYKDQQMRVRWGNSFSDVFSVSNGAR